MRATALVLTLVAAAGCASSGPAVRPQIQLIQVYAPADLAYPRGQNTMTAEFAFQITNPAAEPLTLRRVQLESSSGGAYVLRREDKPFEIRIGPGEVAQGTIAALAYYETNAFGATSNEPVTLRATFHFQSANGSFRQVVLRNVSQFPEGPR